MAKSRKEAELDELIEEGVATHKNSIVRPEQHYFTRHVPENIIPFTVNQKDEPTCAYVTSSKVLLYNLLGLFMNISLSTHEQKLIDSTTRMFEVRSNIPIESRYLTMWGFSPNTCSVPGFTFIALFFYFFEWFRVHDMRPYFHRNGTITDSFKRPYEMRNDLNTFLTQLPQRIGAKLPAASGWLEVLFEPLRKSIKKSYVEWKNIHVLTLNSEYTPRTISFTQPRLKEFCDKVIYPITSLSLRIIVHLQNTILKDFLHAVMVVGIDSGNLILSNSWGTKIDVVPISSLPNVTLNVGKIKTEWEIFDFEFILPIFLGYPRPQFKYSSENINDFLTFVKDYVLLMKERERNDIPFTIFEGLHSRTLVGGLTRRNRFLRRSQRAIKRSHRKRVS
jgi:hypothetical protein